MRKLSILLAIAMMITVIGCGKKAEEAKQAFDVLKDLPKKAEQMQQNIDQGEKKKQERRQRGDTLALNFKKLQEYLPKSVDGYGEAKLGGESVNMGGFSMSSAKADYEKADGSSSVHIELVDYNENYGLYAGLAFWMQGYSMENDQRYERTFGTGIENTWALEKFEKHNGEAELIYALSWRFMLTLRADGQKDTEFLKSVAKKIDMAALAKM